MARTVSERLRRSLVADMHAKGVLSSPRVRAAFLAVAREHFLPEALANGGLKAVYRDDAIVTKRNSHGLPLSSSSQPSLMAKMLELLDVRPGDRLLEVGAGTGYNAALLAHLSGPSGRVTSIDIDPDLARRARRSLRDAGTHGQIEFGVQVNFNGATPESLAGKNLNILADTNKSARVTLHWKDDTGAVQKTSYEINYAMRLEFGAIAKGKLPGKIYLCTPDTEKSYLMGTFNASLPRKGPPKK